MPTFNSLEDVMKYVKKATADSMKEVGDKVEDIMKEEIQSQVYDAYPDNEHRTGQLKQSVETTKISDNSVEVSWRDNGDWFSLINGDHMYVIHGLEMGKTWNRPGTNLVEESKQRADIEVPDVYKKAMRSKGVPIK